MHLHLVLGCRPLRHRTDLAEHFTDPEVRKSIETNLALLDHDDRLLTDLELHLTRSEFDARRILWLMSSARPIA